MRGRVVVTGGAGFLGRVLCDGLRRRGWAVDVFDRATSQGADDILDLRARLTRRFAGARSVVHLAGIPHPFTPDAVDEDFRRINLLGSLNVFEAAREAGAGSFVFASSGQVYGINALRPSRFPLREDDPVPGPDQGANLYGLLKHQVELALADAARTRPGPTTSTALRLEMPGLRSTHQGNHFVSTTVENLLAGVAAAVEAPPEADGETFNLCDAWVGLDVVDMQSYLSQRFPGVPSETIGNESVLDVTKAVRGLGYEPRARGTYLGVDTGR